MRLVEADAKDMLRRAGMSIPDGMPATTGRLPESLPESAFVKAQVLAGGRGKQGLVRRVAGHEISRTVDEMTRESGCSNFLIEEPVDIEHEYYVALRIDDLSQRPVVLFSQFGGVEVETLPEQVHRFPIDPLAGVAPYQLVPLLAEADVPRRYWGAVARAICELHRVFVANDAVLLELNPLAVTKAGRIVVVDAKAVVDENAQYRNRHWGDLLSFELERAQLTELERRAADQNFTFVDMEGDVALLTGGAGLGLAVVDMMADAGLKPANFIDAPGGSGMEDFVRRARLVFERARRPEVKVIVMYNVLSATPLAGLVDGLIKVLGEMQPPKPLVVGFAAAGAAEQDMTAAQAVAALRERGYEAVVELGDLVAAATRAARSGEPGDD